MKTCFWSLKLFNLLLCSCIVFGDGISIHKKYNTSEYDITIMSNGTAAKDFAVLARVTFTATLSATTVFIVYLVLIIATKLYKQRREECFIEMV